MHLVFNHVTQFQHVGHTYSSLLLERLSRTTIVQSSFAITRQTCFISPCVQVVQRSSIKDRSSKLNAQLLSCTSQYGFKDLTNVHTRRHTQRIQHNVNRSSVSQERHVFLTHYAGNDTLVTVTSGHLVTDTDLTLLGNVNFSHLNDTGRQFVANGNGKFLTFQFSIQFFILLDEVHYQSTDQRVGMFILRPAAQLDGSEVQIAKIGSMETGTLRNNIGSHIILHAFRSQAISQLQKFINQYLT